MNLYEINKEILDLIDNCVDRETGEIAIDANERLDGLLKDKNQKIINTAKFIKNRLAFVEMMKQEVKHLQARVKSEESRMEWLETYAKNYMVHGEKYEDPQVSVSLRKSSRVDVLNMDLIPQEFKRVNIEVSADKKAIGDAIKSGKEISGAIVADAYSIQIK